MVEDQQSQLTTALEKMIRHSFADGMELAFSTRVLARQLLREISASSRNRESTGQRFAHDQYTLSLNPQDFSTLSAAAAQIQSSLSSSLQEYLESHDYLLAHSPLLTLATDPTLKSGQVRVIGWHSSDPLGFNHSSTENMIERKTAPSQAFLIVNGKKKYMIGKEDFSIGRRLDNDLILEDSHVSRRHAQLELHEGCYHITDTGSKAGVYLNSRPVRRAPLQPGDLISICGYQIIYGEGAGAEQIEDHSEPDHEAKQQIGEHTTPVHLNQSNQGGTRPMTGARFNNSDQVTRPTSDGSGESSP